MSRLYSRWLLSALVVTATSVHAQRPAAPRPASRPLAATPKPAPPARLPEPAPAVVVSVRDSAHNRFVVPQVQLPGAAPAVAARINQELVDAALGEDLEALPQPLTAEAGIRQALAEYDAHGQSGFVGASYEVLYNDHNLLSVALTAEYMAAYPSTLTRRVTFELGTGRVLEVRDLVADTLALQRRWQQSISRRVAAHLRALPNDYPQLDADMLAEVRRRVGWNDTTQTARLEPGDPRFYDFALTPFGLMLYYDFGFPHVIEALQPEADYLFPYAELSAWLKPNGPLEFRRESAAVRK